MIDFCKASVKHYTIAIDGLHDFIRVACQARLVADHIVTREEDTIARDHPSRLKQHDITNDNILYVDVPLASIAQYLDKTAFLVLVVLVETPCVLQVAQQNSQDNDEDSGNSSNATDPVNWGALCKECCSNAQKGAEGEKKYCRNRP